LPISIWNKTEKNSLLSLISIPINHHHNASRGGGVSAASSTFKVPTDRPTACRAYPLDIAGIPWIHRPVLGGMLAPARRWRSSAAELAKLHSVDADVIHRRQNDVIIDGR